MCEAGRNELPFKRLCTVRRGMQFAENRLGGVVVNTRMNYVRPSEPESFSFLNRLLAGLREARKLTYILVAVAFLASTAYYALTPDRYLATAKVMPASGSGPDKTNAMVSAMIEGSALSSLVSSKLMAEANIYVELLRSNTVLDEVLGREYSGVLNGRAGNLYKLWDIDTPQLARQKLISKSSFTGNSKTGIVTVTVETTCPVLSSEIANEYVAELDEFKQSLDRSMAGKVSEFLARQLAEQRKKVEKAEVKQAEFLAANRNYLSGDDPELTMEVDRLERDVLFERQVLLNLMQLCTTSDMEREKELPRLSVLEWATPTQVKSGPHRIKSILMTTFAGLVLAIGIVALRESYRWHFPLATRNELESSCQTVGQDVRQIVSRIRQPRRDTVGSDA